MNINVQGRQNAPGQTPMEDLLDRLLAEAKDRLHFSSNSDVFEELGRYGY